MRFLETPENADFEKVSAHVRLLETIWCSALHIQGAIISQEYFGNIIKQDY